jgi:hypothetical protein
VEGFSNAIGGDFDRVGLVVGNGAIFGGGVEKVYYGQREALFGKFGRGLKCLLAVNFAVAVDFERDLYHFRNRVE